MPLRITTEPLPGRDAALVHVRGPLTATSRHQLRGAVDKALADCPVAVIVDLSGVYLVDQVAGAVFVAMRRSAAAMGPGVELILTGAADFLANRIRALNAAPLYPDVTSAADAFDDPARTRWLFRRLSTADGWPAAAAEAGVLVAEACAAWGLPDLTYPARAAVFDLFLAARRCPPGDRTITARTDGDYLVVGVRTPPSDLLWPCNRRQAPYGYRHRITRAGHHLHWVTLP